MAGQTVGQGYVQIIPSADGIKGAISNVLNGEATSAGTSAGSKIGNLLKAGIVAAGLGKVIASALEEGARYEQAKGGIETLFDGYAEEMIAAANNAYKIGLSANSYMEQSTSFAAALKQTLGDSASAGKAADLAVRSMADNSAKLGTDISSIQMAYQGFAKQNYTMLDNLKLGYGGTKTEMERLIKDASTMTDEMDRLGISVDGNSMSFDNVINAIAVMQEHLGIAGVAAKEAETTLSGSANAMKAAWSDLLAQLMMGGDVSTAMSNLGVTITNFIANLIPAIGNIFAGLPQLLVTLIGEAIPNAINMLTELAKGLLVGSGNDMASSLGESFGSKILPAMGNLVLSIIELVATLPGALFKIAVEMATGFVKGIWDKIVSGVQSVVDKIKSLFNFKLSLPHIPVPHFSIRPSGWHVGDLLKGSIPSLSVRWAAKGGIVDGATLIGAGEKGAEAIVPLDPFWRRIDDFGKRLAEAEKDNNHKIEITVVTQLDGKVLAKETAPLIDARLSKYQTLAMRGV